MVNLVVDDMEEESSKFRQNSNKEKILLVGEGDFSFSLSVAKAFGSSTNITVTSLDTREWLGCNYNNGKVNVEELERLGCTVVRGANVHSMTSDSRLGRYDTIIFHFPHGGKHYEVVRGFLGSARDMLNNEDGEIHVTHKTICPFNKWDIKAIAEENGLRLIKKMKFINWAIPGYSNKRGSGSNCDNYFYLGSDVTFMFKK